MQVFYQSGEKFHFPEQTNLNYTQHLHLKRKLKIRNKKFLFPKKHSRFSKTGKTELFERFLRHIIINQEFTTMKAMFNLLVLIGILFTTSCQPAKTSTEKAPAPTSTSNIQPPENNEGVDMIRCNRKPTSQNNDLTCKGKPRKKVQNQRGLNPSGLNPGNNLANNLSLGCPQTGFVYEQVLTPGFQMLFEAGGQSYSYHTDAASRVILCRIHPVDEVFLTP